MKSLLIFTPGWNPSSPYMALPILKSYLYEMADIFVEIKDCNVEFYDYIYSEIYLKQCLEKISTKLLPEYVENTINMFRESIKDIEYAKKILRSTDYLIPDIRKYVDTIFSNVTYIINTAWDGLKVTFNGIDLKYNKSNSSEVFWACTDLVANPYIEYFKENVIPYIQKNNINFVGLSITGHTQLIPALTLCYMIKELCIDVKHISLGGNYITRAADMLCNSGLFNKNFFDSIMLYDGEISCKELIQTLESNLHLQNVHNLIYNDNGKWIHTDFLVNNIVNICAPDYSDFPLHKYFAPATIFPIYTSRSCYNKCAFCTIPNATSGNYRALPISIVINNIKTLYKKYNARHFFITDETFDINRMDRIANCILNEKLDIFWYCETRFSDNFSLEICRRLYKSGCRQIEFGLESYNQRVLDKMKKNTKIEWINNTINNCIESGISVHLFFFTGFPTETYEEAMNTYRYTSNVVRKSQMEYNVLWSRGYGAFGLEIGSTVWLYPEQYNIDIIENGAENDLRLDVDYIAYEGLTQEESMNLVKIHNLRKVLQKQSCLDYELPWMDYLPEVHMAIISSDNLKVEKVYPTYVLSGLKIKDLIYENSIIIPSEVSIATTPTFFLFYNRRFNRVYKLNRKYARLQEPVACFKFDEFFYENDMEVFNHISLLYHFKFIEISNIDREIISVNEKTILLKSTNIDEYYSDILGEWILINRITNDSVTVNQLSYKILELFSNPLSLEGLLILLKKHSINLSRESLFNLLNYYLEHDIIYGLI